MQMDDFINFSCAHCDQPLEAPTDMVGSSLPCPSCGNQIFVPRPQVRSSTVTSPKKKSSLALPFIIGGLSLGTLVILGTAILFYFPCDSKQAKNHQSQDIPATVTQPQPTIDLAPTSLQLTATVDNKEVPAKALINTNSYTLPKILPLEYEKDYNITLSYDSPNGISCKQQLSFTANWRGLEEMKAVLVPITPIENIQLEPKGPVEGKDWISPTTGMAFVWIPSLKIWVGKYEVTNKEYRMMNTNHKSYCDLSRRGGLNGDSQPVVMVTFKEAKTFAEWLAQQDNESLYALCYRLPSVAEFMQYVRCGDYREYPWGNDWPPLYGNYLDRAGIKVFSSPDVIELYNDGFDTACPVEKSGKNDWGLYGVGGNAWEYCAVSTTPNALLGGWYGASWGTKDRKWLRCEFSLPYALSRDDNVGFRLVLSP